MDNNNQFSPDRKRSNYKNRFNFYMNDRNNNNDYSYKDRNQDNFNKYNDYNKFKNQPDNKPHYYQQFPNKYPNEGYNKEYSHNRDYIDKNKYKRDFNQKFQNHGYDNRDNKNRRDRGDSPVTDFRFNRGGNMNNFKSRMYSPSHKYDYNKDYNKNYRDRKYYKDKSRSRSREREYKRDTNTNYRKKREDDSYNDDHKEINKFQGESYKQSYIPHDKERNVNDSDQNKNNFDDDTKNEIELGEMSKGDANLETNRSISRFGFKQDYSQGGYKDNKPPYVK